MKLIYRKLLNNTKKLISMTMEIKTYGAIL